MGVRPQPAEVLADLALLSSMSAVVHYFWGVWGILVALALAAALEHGPAAYHDVSAAIASGKLASNAIGARLWGPASPLGTAEGEGDETTRDRQHDSEREGNQAPRGDGAVEAAVAIPVRATMDEPPHGRRRDNSVLGGSGDGDALIANDANVSRLRIRDVASRPAAATAPSRPPLCANSPSPIPFETDLFVGRVLFLVRTPSSSLEATVPYAELFDNKRRMFWIQVQGRFKRAPRGAVFLGGELPARIAPGFFTRSLALVIVGLIRQLLPVNNVHFSFGDDDREEIASHSRSARRGSASRQTRELPAISFPLYQSVDQFVDTPEGEEPPELGSVDFGETLEMRQQRRQTPLGAENFVVGNTYSFHFHTMYVDLTKWETVNLPGLSAMDLSTFFDSLPLRLVAYDVVNLVDDDKHAQADKDYLFSFEIQYDRQRTGGDSGRDRTRIADTNGAAEDDDDDDVMMTVSSTSSSSTRGSRAAIGVEGPNSSDLSTRSSTNVSDELISEIDEDNLSSSLSTATGEMDSSFRQQHRKFLARENARRLAHLAPAFLCWMEELDLESGVRVIHYVFSVSDLSVSDEDEEIELEQDGDGEARGRTVGQRRLAIVSAHALRSVLVGRDKGKRVAGHYGKMSNSSNSATEGSKSNQQRQELQAMRFHTRSRIGSYSSITDEALEVVGHMQALLLDSQPKSNTTSDDSQRSSDHSTDSPDLDAGGNLCNDGDDDDDDDDDEEVMAARSALYQALLRRQWLQSPEATAASMSPSRLGVNLSRREREELGVVFEGVVYRYYADALLRQEVLQLSVDALLFYRSYSPRPEKRVASESVIGVRAVPVPLLSSPASASESSGVGAFALEISTLGEQIVVCLGTAFARDAWLRVLEQHCDPCTNATKWLAPAAMLGNKPRQLQMQMEQQLRACKTSSGPRLQPAQRIVLNSWSLFPAPAPSAPSSDKEEASQSIELVAQTLRQALAIHATHEKMSASAGLANTTSTKQVLAFLERASAVRAIDLQLIQDKCSHEQQLAFYLNLFHLMLAHAMMAHGFPRGRRSWDTFLRSMCYSLRRQQPRRKHHDHHQDSAANTSSGKGYAQVTVSLAELEHLVLRARMPRADIPHLRLNAMARAPSASRLVGLGLRHPDFRVSLALATNQHAEHRVRVFSSGPEIHTQLNAVASALLHSPSGLVEVRETASIVRLPRVCEWYRRDFGRSPLNALRKLLGFLDSDLQRQVLRLLEREQPVHLEYRSFKYTPKNALLLLGEDNMGTPEIEGGNDDDADVPEEDSRVTADGGGEEEKERELGIEEPEAGDGEQPDGNDRCDAVVA